MRRTERALVHDGDVEPPLQFLREAYRDDGSVPGRDDTVNRLFDQYMEALDGPAPRRSARVPARAASLARALRRRMHRAMHRPHR